MEFWLLRRAITERIGATGMPLPRLISLWGAGILAGMLGLAITHVWAPVSSFVASALAIVTFAAVYGAVTLALGVPEARAMVARVRRR